MKLENFKFTKTTNVEFIPHITENLPELIKQHVNVISKHKIVKMFLKMNLPKPFYLGLFSNKS